MTRQFWLAAAAYIVPTFPLGYIWHLSIFKPQYDALGLYRADVIIPLGLTAMVVQGLLFAWLYPRLFNTASAAWLSSATKFSLVFGTLAWSFLVLPVAAKYNMTSAPRFIALETAFTALQYAVTGPLIAWAWRASTAPRA